MDNESVKADLDMTAWVELFGHTSFAAHVVSAPVGPAMFLRCDVCDGKGGTAFTRMVNPSAVYSMTPIEDAAAQALMARRGGATPPVPVLMLRPGEVEAQGLDAAIHPVPDRMRDLIGGDELDEGRV